MTTTKHTASSNAPSARRPDVWLARLAR